MRSGTRGERGNGGSDGGGDMVNELRSEEQRSLGERVIAVVTVMGYDGVKGVCYIAVHH